MLRVFAGGVPRVLWLLTGLVVVATPARALGQDASESAAHSLPDPGAGVAAGEVARVRTAQTSLDGHARGTFVLRGLYGSFAALQVLDTVSTQRVLSQGGTEANPILGPFVGNTAAFIAVKAASTVTTIALTHRLSKKSRIGAIATMAALNTIYAVVVSHNVGEARRAAAR